MPAKSQQQLKMIYALRNKYKTKKDTPEEDKWIWNEEWTKDVKMKKLPKKVKENRRIKLFEDYRSEMEESQWYKLKELFDEYKEEINMKDIDLIKQWLSDKGEDESFAEEILNML